MREDQSSEINCGISFEKAKERFDHMSNNLVIDALSIFNDSKIVAHWDESEKEFNLPDGSVKCPGTFLDSCKSKTEDHR